MEYFLDSANPETIRSVKEIYPLAGVTTNPIIIAREKAELLPLLREIRSVLDPAQKLFVQVVSAEAGAMLREAEKIRKAIDGPLSVKVPMTAEGLKAIRGLTAEGFAVTATAVYTPQQALLAAAAGAVYAAPYISHLDNMDLDGPDIAGQMAVLLKEHFPSCRILGASFRVASQVNRVIERGAGAVTLTAEMFHTLLASRGTDAELEAFRAAWRAVYGEQTVEDLL